MPVGSTNDDGPSRLRRVLRNLPFSAKANTDRSAR
jgi:hypothetical protein